MNLLDWSARPIRFASWLAFVSVTGIVTMLIVDGVWDALALALMALPLALGVCALRRN